MQKNDIVLLGIVVTIALITIFIVVNEDGFTPEQLERLKFYRKLRQDGTI